VRQALVRMKERVHGGFRLPFAQFVDFFTFLAIEDG
jgi:hypothetical protein